MQQSHRLFSIGIKHWCFCVLSHGIINCFGQNLRLNLEIVTVCLLHHSSWQSHLDSRQGIINVLRGLFLFPQVGVVEQFTPPQLLEGSYLTSLFFTRWGLHGYGHWWLGAGAVSEFLLANECVAGAGEQLPGGCLRTNERKKRKKGTQAGYAAVRRNYQALLWTESLLPDSLPYKWQLSMSQIAP